MEPLNHFSPYHPLPPITMVVIGRNSYVYPTTLAVNYCLIQSGTKWASKKKNIQEGLLRHPTIHFG
jgi:hypothetical protein